MDASEERQIFRGDPAQHEASRLQPICAVGEGHFEGAFMSAAFSYPPSASIIIRFA